MKTKSPVSQHIRTDPKPGSWHRNVDRLKTMFIHTIRTCSQLLLDALLQRGGDTTAHTRHQWFWCCGVLLGKEPTTSWCNKQHQGFQIEAEFFMDCFVFYQNVWRLFLFLNFCVSLQNINVLHWTGPGPPLTQWDHTEPLTRVQSAAELGPTVCILFRSSLFDFWFLSQVKLTNQYSLWRHAG